MKIPSIGLPFSGRRGVASNPLDVRICGIAGVPSAFITISYRFFLPLTFVENLVRKRLLTHSVVAFPEKKTPWRGRYMSLAAGLELPLFLENSSDFFSPVPRVSA